MTTTLGIDIGTSKIAVIIFNNEKNTVISSISIPTEADLPVKEGRHEQDSQKIFDCLDMAISKLPEKEKQKVSAIGVTGQQHGVVMWNKSTKETSHLITWRDNRCLENNFLESIKKISLTISSGFGNATLAWCAQHEPEEIKRFDACGTIQDFCVFKIAGLSEVKMDPTNAASWGCFDVRTNEWKKSEIEKLNIPITLLPKNVECKTIVGELTSRYAGRWGIPSGIPVIAAIGDNQASLYSTLVKPEEEIALTLGTGGQISVVIPKDFSENITLNSKFEIRPYFDGSFIAVGAALLGGGAFRWLLETLTQCIKDIGMTPPERDVLYSKLNALSLKGDSTKLKFNPHFAGERFDPYLRGSITGIDTENFNLGNLGASLSEGIILNLKNMLPEEILSNRTRIMGSGNGLRRLSVLREATERIFGIPLVLTEEREEAAVGAAMAAYSVKYGQ